MIGFLAVSYLITGLFITCFSIKFAIHDFSWWFILYIWIGLKMVDISNWLFKRDNNYWD